ncbi:hypothetical protein ArsFIN_53520 (plasmid) [Arsenophonus nasoniae]|uniref:Uncharacterized protein n=1 Tax=Arsenophonus nasoniae TaxID=638 RepID=A0A4P7L2F0_9GAMM|nr:hypothetical protein ArsFIN_53520 [Arsenophonus nasoniae]
MVNGKKLMSWNVFYRYLFVISDYADFYFIFSFLHHCNDKQECIDDNGCKKCIHFIPLLFFVAIDDGRSFILFYPRILPNCFMISLTIAGSAVGQPPGNHAV